jgi:hypothetical protein
MRERYEDNVFDFNKKRFSDEFWKLRREHIEFTYDGHPTMIMRLYHTSLSVSIALLDVRCPKKGA